MAKKRSSGVEQIWLVVTHMVFRSKFVVPLKYLGLVVES